MATTRKDGRAVSLEKLSVSAESGHALETKIAKLPEASLELLSLVPASNRPRYDMFPPENAPTESFPYRIDQQIGIGSTGVVFKAAEVALERTVAIKVLRRSVLDEEPPEVQDELRRRFLQEARAAAALSHPGVTTVFRVGQEGGLPYMVMEWLEGRTLEEVLQETPRLEITEAVRLTVALLETLDAAHRSGVVHRDIKPSNLVLLADGRLKVTDFGIALLKGRELVKTQAGVVLATPKFASPEQLRGIEADGRADLFATGILLYRLLTGEYPFQGKDFMEVSSAILQQEPTPARELRAEIPPTVDGVIHRALRKDREDRFANAVQMAEDLRPFLREDDPDGPTMSGYIPVVRPRQEAEDATQRRPPIHHQLPLDPRLAAVRIVESWPERTLNRQPAAPLIDRLLERPLHAPPFAGAARLDNVCVFVADGILLGAVDAATGECGDRVAEMLPKVCTPRLFPIPDGYPEDIVQVLASILHPPVVRHGDLDSSFINLPALAEKLRDEKFDGVLRLSRAEAFGLICIVGGETVLSAYSEGWGEAPVEQSWQRWIARVPVRANVEEKHLHPLTEWYRRTFRGLELDARPVAANQTQAHKKDLAGTSSSRVRRMFQTTRSKPLETGKLALSLAPTGTTAIHDETSVGYDQSPAFRLARYTVEELQYFFAEREKTTPWKYLSEWIGLVRKVHLHHELPRPGSRDADYFDLVTSDEKGKVLHLGQHLANLTPQAFQEFINRVIAVKKSRLKTGDIGGVFLVSRSFNDDVLAIYSKIIHGASGIWFDVEESFTGYAGFVRIGSRRGFHLLLVEETDSGFSPLI